MRDASFTKPLSQPLEPANLVQGAPRMLEGSLLIAVYVFVLAAFVGFEVITKVPPTLHTPLMSGANAISGVTLIGAVLITGAGSGTIGTILGLAAVILATINVVGGFLVTDRMLQMFRRGREDSK